MKKLHGFQNSCIRILSFRFFFHELFEVSSNKLHMFQDGRKVTQGDDHGQVIPCRVFYVFAKWGEHES